MRVSVVDFDSRLPRRACALHGRLALSVLRIVDRIALALDCSRAVPSNQDVCAYFSIILLSDSVFDWDLLLRALSAALAVVDRGWTWLSGEMTLRLLPLALHPIFSRLFPSIVVLLPLDVRRHTQATLLSCLTSLLDILL